MTTVEAGHIIEITTEYQSSDSEYNNVYFYNNIGIGNGLLDILDGFSTTFLSALRDVIPGTVSLKEIRARNIFEEGSSVTLGVDLQGTSSAGGELLPPFAAAPISLLHDEPRVNSGHKRLGGLTEVWTENGSTYTAQGAAMLAIAKAMMILSFASDGLPSTVMEPVVVGRVEDPPGKYRLPTTELEALARGFGHIEGTVQKPITHQITRGGQ